MEPSNQLSSRLGFKFTILVSILTVILLGIYFVNVGYLAGNSDEEVHLSAEIEPSAPEEPSAIGGNCRYGIGTTSSDAISWIDDFGAGWYLNFGSSASSADNFAEYVPVIRTRQDRVDNDPYKPRLPTYTVSPNFATLKTIIAKRPGGLWIVGNEVDRWKHQDDILPDLYAEAYHEVYHFIKEQDPTAHVAISGLVEVTPGRLQYLDIVWNAYRAKFGTSMPVDVWNMHLYPIPERKWGTTSGSYAGIAVGTNPHLAKYDSGVNQSSSLCSRNDVYCFAEHDKMSIFAEQVTAMRQWMKNHGEQNKPLIISEYSILWPYVNDGGGQCYLRDEFGKCFPPSRVIQFMNSSFNHLENSKDPNLGYPQDGNRLVQQWLWFSTYVDQESGLGGGSSNLLIKGLGSMSKIGVNFRDKVQSTIPSTNLFPVKAFSGPALSGKGSTTADATLWVDVMNNGNHVTDDDIIVTFYSDSGLKNEIGYAVIPKPSGYEPGMVGCATKTIRVETAWPNLPQGKHQYWVRVDSSGGISESNENDNVTTGFVYVDPPYQAYLPRTIK